MRLFISFNFSDETALQISHSAAAMKKLTKGGAYPPVGNYHMTLAFLGECERSQVKHVESAMKAAAAASSPFDVTIGGVGCFRRQSGDVVFVKADGGETLGKFHDEHKDDKKAFAAYMQAAEKGCEISQYRVGDAYLRGKGVAQNDKKGVAWILKAGENGHFEAYAMLSVLYEQGVGVPKDLVKAEYWKAKLDEFLSNTKKFFNG